MLIWIAHLYGFNSNEYFEKLTLIDKYIGFILEIIEKFIDNPFILISTDHGGLGKSNSDAEKKVFIASNRKFDEHKYDIIINSNISSAPLILKNMGIDVPEYFDRIPQTDGKT